jgi:hypothetical protein
MPGPFTSVHTISWNANTESDLAGYKVYVGRASRIYDSEINVGNVTSYDLTITESGQVFLAIKAYDSSGNLSEYSTELSRNFLMLSNF